MRIRISVGVTVGVRMRIEVTEISDCVCIRDWVRDTSASVLEMGSGYYYACGRFPCRACDNGKV